MNHMYKFCKVKEVVLDSCGGTSVTVKTCLYLPERRPFVGCEKDAACFQDVLSLDGKICAQHLCVWTLTCLKARKRSNQTGYF